MGNGSPDVSLLGVNSSSLSCTDVMGVSSVSARCRSGQEGCLIATSTANADLCFQNPSATRNIRLNGTTLSLGDIASPGMTLGDTAVAILKDTTVNNLHASGAIDSGALLSAGVWLGNETTPGFARAVMTCSSTSSRGLLDFS